MADEQVENRSPRTHWMQSAKEWLYARIIAVDTRSDREKLRRGGPGQRATTSAAESGIELLDLMLKRLGKDDLRNLSILDIGCGTRLAEAIAARGTGVTRYAGLDVNPEIVALLRREWMQPNHEYHHVNLHNRQYNPRGMQLTPDFSLPVKGRFDIVCLFSVFTHLDPYDSDCMLSVARRYLNDSGRFIFTCFINDRDVSGFDDRFPDQPLMKAVYNSRLMEHLLAQNGWRVVARYDPTRSGNGYTLMQHCYVCEPSQVILPAGTQALPQAGP